MPNLSSCWSLTEEQLFTALHANRGGLSRQEVAQRLKEYGANRMTRHARIGVWPLLLSQFRSPIILILIFAAMLSAFLGDSTDATIILAIVLVSGLLGFWQEHSAGNAIARLHAIVETKARVQRDGKEVQVPVEDLVPGDLVLFRAGAIIPADCRLLEERDLFVNESTLTGETYPVDKSPGTLPPDTPLARRTNMLFMGTHVMSGTGTALIIHTGRATEFGAIFESLRLRPPETEFEQGIRHFGFLLVEVTLILVISIFAFNVHLGKPVLTSFLFALALAVGLTPQLLPAIISINLSHGARKMAGKKVIVKRLSAIENFGSMDVLCSDKTGTLTEGKVHIHATLDPLGHESAKVHLYAYLNAANESGFVNPIDQAIREQIPPGVEGWRKLDEVPYDFTRRRLSILLEKDGRRLLITKGALAQVLEQCSDVETSEGQSAPLGTLRGQIQQTFSDLGNRGLRVLGVAYRDLGEQQRLTREDETGMTFLGLIVLADPPKEGVDATIHELGQLGVRLKIITGDNALVARHIAEQIGALTPEMLTGAELRQMDTAALLGRVSRVDIFAEIEPGQKERIILALKKAGHVVGYMGDGINDVSALHAADVSISVNEAVDVAREAADFVLLDRQLGVLVDGVREGRRTFANTLKYVFIATSANFGNMFSMAGASLFLSFLPLLPKQILLINLLTDFPEMTIAGDNVDKELVQSPRRWDIHFIRRFMIVFGLLSSAFDYLTFGALLWLKANVEQFRTGWFIESVLSATVIVLVVRTRAPFFKSRPSKWLIVSTALVIAACIATPHLPFASLLGFTALPAHFYGFVALIVLAYFVSAEVVKHFFYTTLERRASKKRKAFHVRPPRLFGAGAFVRENRH